MTTLYQYDIGTLIRVDTGVDISTATQASIYYRKPDGTEGEWVGAPSTTYIEYTTILDDLDVTGDWVMQSYVEMSSGKWRGDLVTVSVRGGLNL